LPDGGEEKLIRMGSAMLRRVCAGERSWRPDQANYREARERILCQQPSSSPGPDPGPGGEQRCITLSPFRDKQPAPEDLARILADLGQNEAEAIIPALALMQDHPGLLEQSYGQPLLAPLLKAAMGPLERDGTWAPMALLLRSLDDKSAAAMEDVLLPAHAVIDPATLSDTTVVVLAGLIDAAGRPGKALALLDGLEATRGNPRFLTLCWQARCHILGVSDAIDALWPGMPISGTGPRVQARHHAQARRMDEALQAFSAALTQAATPAARRGIGADLAVLAAWLHGHGQGCLLEGIARWPVISPIIRHWRARRWTYCCARRPVARGNRCGKAGWRRRAVTSSAPCPGAPRPASST
jgi:hypothetical protein